MPANRPLTRQRLTAALALWIAQGFGVGRIPVAPGTCGSLVGVLWTAALLATGSPWCYAAGALAGVVASVWLCGVAERILGRKDPGSVVLDEIAAVPLCFAGWIGLCLWQTGQMPLPARFLGRDLWLTLAFFGAFRFFDVLKPWPVRQSQALPGGWGIAADDLLAALYVNLLLAAVLGAWTLGTGAFPAALLNLN
jgi:phosphatidylglycerophosphatase A